MTEDMTMVERVARALCRRRLTSAERLDWTRGLRTKPFDPSADVDRFWRQDIDDARAAIAAMREPTDQMCHAGAYDQHDWKPSDEVWRAMIDEALR